ncbi:hypothetical protein PVT67_02465 [Gallaecimonas kandeliae]|uniref:hypothetical protein n=1 Tax=Gallaecimonas kandeliae TaxID=3029055 RepID=UPI002647D287|nr:hypothetical protein [Gallaecimonas kandeliae]WKE66136.1 hypothetical protein PVT67_02465 [Gallaecimonas kandeliae]
MKKFWLATLLFLAACSPSGPSQTELERAAALAEGAVGKDAFLRTDKVRLLDSRLLDKDRLEVALAYDIVFTKDFPEAAHDLGAGLAPDLFARFGSSLAAMSLKMEYGLFRKGERRQRQQHLLLEKGKEGWQLADKQQ